MKALASLTLLLLLLLYNSQMGLAQTGVAIKLRWTDRLDGDFSFKDQWAYPEGISRNTSGQLVCEGICPEESEQLKDAEGNIDKDQLATYYTLVDTTHLFYSLSSEAQAYEWAGTHFITATWKHSDTVVAFTHNNAATHSSLQLLIAGDKCIPSIHLNSITASGTKIYPCTGGNIIIDRKYWEMGILKAEFDCTFEDKDQKMPMYWKEKIYTYIRPE